MASGWRRRIRKHRRKWRAVRRFGRSAAPIHCSPSGRTGQIRSKKLLSVAKHHEPLNVSADVPHPSVDAFCVRVKLSGKTISAPTDVSWPRGVRLPTYGAVLVPGSNDWLRSRTCERCGAPPPVTVHHEPCRGDPHAKRVGLCRRCHDTLHGTLPKEHP